MKRIICLIVLILISNFVFAEDYTLGNGLVDNADVVDSGTGNIEVARLRADISNLADEVESLKELNNELLKASDVNVYADSFFIEARKEINSFMSNLLVLTCVFYVFILSSLFLLKSKRLF